MTKGSRYIREWNDDANPSSQLGDDTRKLLAEYAKLEAKSGVMEKHVIQIAKEAFGIESFPCFQKFTFLQFYLCRSPKYQLILEEIKAGNLFLDLGCGLGQEIRRLVYDGAPSENLIALELQQGFVDLGYKLFQDREHLKSNFLVQSFFEDTPEIMGLAGKVRVINSGMFMHLWDWDAQVKAAKRMIKLLTAEKGAIIAGLHFGCPSPGMWKAVKDSPMFIHNQYSLKGLWDQCAHETGTSWDFQCVVEKSEDWQDLDPEALNLRWTAVRL
ncbi:hypothetical protein ASPVEDRAFT_36083 [Aspergillus versicolor CBS 583.65]|uniref:Methyltransferase domain-containing protein n=1 Tax=Aspergillus versicolor CBS 583.65 TaxID=1036611 RepID=A0A1L9P566_ASPVE|nr:uncharacterized protein ASPVEDRAFT_36083 [Aspergillus versicolor CBS 583.65]OJI96677.1 hypothetical protein ASPVEDRAFT_36083 [Aspergillus versicolor CBS 583.65]